MPIPWRSTSNRVGPLCKQVGRSNFRHFLSECTHLQEEEDRRYMAKVRQVINLLDDEDEQHSPEPEVSKTVFARIDYFLRRKLR